MFQLKFDDQMPTIFANLFKFAKNIQDRVGVVTIKICLFRAKLPMSVVSDEIGKF